MLLEVFFGITFPRYIQAFAFVLFHVRKGLENKCNVGVNFFLKVGNTITCCRIYVEEASQKPMKQKNHWVYMYVYHFSWNFAHSSFCKAGKIAMQDIYTSLQLKQNTLLYVYDGVISTAGIQNAKCLTVSVRFAYLQKKVLVV